MTPKEKAEELVKKYINADFNCKGCKIPYCDEGCTQLGVREAKQCALIAVDKILSASPMFPRQSRPMKRANGTDMVITDYPPFLYWNEVKNEIEKL